MAFFHQQMDIINYFKFSNSIYQISNLIFFVFTIFNLGKKIKFEILKIYCKQNTLSRLTIKKD